MMKRAAALIAAVLATMLATTGASSAQEGPDEAQILVEEIPHIAERSTISTYTMVPRNRPRTNWIWRSAMKMPMSGRSAEHCEYFAKSTREAAKAARELAAAHEQMAKEAK